MELLLHSNLGRRAWGRVRGEGDGEGAGGGGCWQVSKKNRDTP